MNLLPVSLDIAWLRLSFDEIDGGPAPTVNEWRSVFGLELRRQQCLTGASSCGACPVRPQCRYAHLFDTPPPADTAWMQGVDHVPHPMLLRAASDAPARGAALEVVLFGRATVDAALVAGSLVRAAMRGVGKRRVRWRLRSVCARTGERQAWMDLDPGDSSGWVVPLVDLRPPACPQGATIEFVSPVRLQRQGRPIGAQALAFADLHGGLMRRISSIACLHHGSRWQADFRGLAERAREVSFVERRLRWEESNRYSARQQSTMPLGGVMGHARMQGDLTEFWPHLWMGQWLHVGKATMFGMGRYRLAPDGPAGRPVADGSAARIAARRQQAASA